MNTKGRGD